ncbi:MAG TPA: dihydrodipicolinate synthase family protein [Oscillatoriales cyanobacterium M4454_W2019_049]|nr:dihydrodipicolinate synthase family protein [Oscillatoriales cyanobacterium M4454_W2019_049]
MFQGLYAVLVTPFQENGEVDETSVDRLVEFYLEHNVSGLVTLSVMGEGLQLTDDEKMRVARRVVRRTGDRVPVVVGINNREATTAAQFARRVVDLGVSGLLVMPPSQPGLETAITHYRTIADAAPVAIAILDYPPLTGKLPVPFLKALVEAVDAIRGIKLEDTPTPAKIQQLRNAVGSRLQILGAMGGLHCLPELEAGSNGLMTGYAYPEHLVDILNQFQSGDVAGAIATYSQWLPLLECEQKYGLALRKESLRQRGAIASAKVRMSGVTMNNNIRLELDRVLKQLELRGDSNVRLSEQSNSRDGLYSLR